MSIAHKQTINRRFKKSQPRFQKIKRVAADMSQFMTRNLNQRIRFARKLRRFSLREVGTFFEPHISAQAVRAWERELKPATPEPWRLEVLALHLQVNYNWLTTGSGSHDTPDEKTLIFENLMWNKFIPYIRLQDVSVENIKAAMTKALMNQSVRPSFWDDDKERFSTEVEGTSMAPTYNEGDVVYFLKSNSPQPGDYVAIDVSSLKQTIFRKFRYNEDGNIVLEPENKNWRPLVFGEEQLNRDIHVIGILCGHFARS